MAHWLFVFTFKPAEHIQTAVFATLFPIKLFNVLLIFVKYFLETTIDTLAFLIIKSCIKKPILLSLCTLWTKQLYSNGFIVLHTHEVLRKFCPLGQQSFLVIRPSFVIIPFRLRWSWKIIFAHAHSHIVHSLLQDQRKFCHFHDYCCAIL